MHPLDLAQFWAKVQKSGDCWEWTGGRDKDGYGIMTTSVRTTQKCWRVHRFSWTAHFGDIPDGLFVLHQCDNPPCVRPDHLFVGTDKDNITDARAKRRLSGQQKTHCPNDHEYTEANTYWYNGRRRCRECMRIRSLHGKRRLRQERKFRVFTMPGGSNG